METKYWPRPCPRGVRSCRVSSQIATRLSIEKVFAPLSETPKIPKLSSSPLANARIGFHFHNCTREDTPNTIKAPRYCVSTILGKINDISSHFLLHNAQTPTTAADSARKSLFPKSPLGEVTSNHMGWRSPGVCILANCQSTRRSCATRPQAKPSRTFSPLPLAPITNAPSNNTHCSASFPQSSEIELQIPE